MNQNLKFLVVAVFLLNFGCSKNPVASSGDDPDSDYCTNGTSKQQLICALEANDASQVHSVILAVGPCAKNPAHSTTLINSKQEIQNNGVPSDRFSNLLDWLKNVLEDEEDICFWPSFERQGQTAYLSGL